MKKFLSIIGIIVAFLFLSLLINIRKQKDWDEFKATGDPQFVGEQFARGFTNGWNTGAQETLDSISVELLDIYDSYYIYDSYEIIREYLSGSNVSKKDAETALNEIESISNDLWELWQSIDAHEIYIESKYEH